jgi:hypothetical protein
VSALVVATIGGCGSTTTATMFTPSAGPVVLAQTCPDGPYCITGQIDDQYAVPVPGVRCSVRGEQGQVLHTKSDARGVFLLDELPVLPREIRFEKPGYASETVSVVAMAARGAATRTYVTMQKIDDSECSCESTALITGQKPCPIERCRGGLTGE